MKKLIISILTIALPIVAAQAQPSAADADALARDGKYAEAADAYEAVLNTGMESADLYYNLGYSYFKQGMLGKAILNFERCQRLNPSDPDVTANLAHTYDLQYFHCPVLHNSKVNGRQIAYFVHTIHAFNHYWLQRYELFSKKPNLCKACEDKSNLVIPP